MKLKYSKINGKPTFQIDPIHPRDSVLFMPLVQIQECAQGDHITCGFAGTLNEEQADGLGRALLIASSVANKIHTKSVNPLIDDITQNRMVKIGGLLIDIVNHQPRPCKIVKRGLREEQLRLTI